ncbi:uncharacterized protein LOC129755637 [Uranotaenia lowii]|uniref:uncharacterized protein LOC129755637 n=1 Tax=Uranotaenia lowii TaxID=190385 RepID=UPI002479FC0C|nr:uncharacterized protein LOC129755637 [Uranotaenia lowii]
MARKRLILLLLICGTLLLPLVSPVAGDLMQDLSNGVRMAGKFFGIDTISDVANLVAKGFANRNPAAPGAPGAGPGPEQPEADTGSGPNASSSQQQQQQAASMMMLVSRLIGLDGGKLGALVMNALIFVAHVIATNFGTFKKAQLDQPAASSKPDEPSSILHSESPLDWLLNNPPKQFRSLLNSVKDGNLTDYLEQDLAELREAPDDQSGCIKLLMCKIKPFIQKMQQVVLDRVNANRDEEQAEQLEPEEPPSVAEIIYKSVPSLQDFKTNSARCEKQFRHCVRMYS